VFNFLLDINVKEIRDETQGLYDRIDIASSNCLCCIQNLKKPIKIRPTKFHTDPCLEKTAKKSQS